MDATTMRTIRPQVFDPVAWEPFGWVPLADTDPADGRQTLSFAWSDPHVNVIGHTLEELRPVDGGLCCDELFRHETHTQTLMSLDNRAVIAVAPASSALADDAAMEEVRVLLVEPLQPFVLHRGTWHWGPYPVGAERVRLFNVQGLRYAEDNDRADLSGRGLSFRVALDGM